MSFNETIEDLRDDLAELGFKSILAVKYYADSDVYVSNLNVTNPRTKTKFVASGFPTFVDYLALLNQALVFVETGAHEGETIHLDPDEPFHNEDIIPLKGFSMGGNLKPEGYVKDVLDALDKKWSFVDSVSNDRYRHILIQRSKWHNHFSQTSFPVMAKTGANFDILIHNVIQKAYKAYEDYPDKVVYVDVFGNVKVDEALTKAIHR